MSKRSLLPAKLQVPVAVILGLLFVVHILWRTGVLHGVTADAPIRVAVADTPAQAVPIDDLRTLMQAMDQRSQEEHAARPHPPVLARNPFVWEVDEPPATGTQTAAPDPDATHEAAARTRFLETLEFAGTCIAGGEATAIVEGKLLAAGDEIGGFTVRAVRPQEIELEDPDGIAIVSMTSPHQRSLEETQLLLEIKEHTS